MNTHLRRAAAAALTAAALALAAPSAQAMPIPAVRPVVGGSQDSGCTYDFSKGWASVDLVIVNNTSFPLTYEPSLSGPSAGHWNKRPLDVLQPGQCEVVNAYVSADVHVFNLNVVYSTPWGDWFPFQAVANATDFESNPYVFQNQPTYSSGSGWSGAIDSRYSITASNEKGLLHTHYTLTVS